MAAQGLPWVAPYTNWVGRSCPKVPVSLYEIEHFAIQKESRRQPIPREGAKNNVSVKLSLFTINFKSDAGFIFQHIYILNVNTHMCICKYIYHYIYVHYG